MACTVAVETAITEHYNEYNHPYVYAIQSEYQSINHECCRSCFKSAERAFGK
jgi:hypothetical protein